MDVTLDYNPQKRQSQIISEYLHNIREHFSVKVDKFGSARYNPFIPDRKYVITPGGYFEIGLHIEILRFLKKQDIAFNLILTDEFKKAIDCSYGKLSVWPLKLHTRNYQDRIIEKCIEHGYGTVVLGTGGGKTLTMATLIYSIGMGTKTIKKCLIIVPNIGLVNQTYGDFIEYGLPAHNLNKWSGTNPLNLDAPIIIANTGILQSAKSDLDWLSTVDLLIFDECHQIKRDNKINKIIDKISTMHKFGFTGTLPENQLDQWNIFGKLGPVIYEKSAAELRSENYVANAIIVCLKISYRSQPETIEETVNATDQYHKELEFLIRNEFRNNTIAKLSQNFKNNALILVDRIEHGEILYQVLVNQLIGKQVFFIKGEVEVEDRRIIQDLIEKHNNVVCVAISKIFAVGINIRNLHYIVFAAGGKAKVKVVQSIGRGLRLHENKDKLTIIDLGDNLPYGQRHLQARKKLYVSEKISVIDRTLSE